MRLATSRPVSNDDHLITGGVSDSVGFSSQRAANFIVLLKSTKINAACWLSLSSALALIVALPLAYWSIVNTRRFIDAREAAKLKSRKLLDESGYDPEYSADEGRRKKRVASYLKMLRRTLDQAHADDDTIILSRSIAQPRLLIDAADSSVDSSDSDDSLD